MEKSPERMRRASLYHSSRPELTGHRFLGLLCALHGGAAVADERILAAQARELHLRPRRLIFVLKNRRNALALRQLKALLWN